MSIPTDPVISDYEIDDAPCPACGSFETRYRSCSVIGCDDGFIDEHDDDPINYAPGEEQRLCEECHGTGVVRWCAQCGTDLTLSINDDPYDSFLESVDVSQPISSSDRPNMLVAAAPKVQHVPYHPNRHERRRAKALERRGTK